MSQVALLLGLLLYPGLLSGLLLTVLLGALVNGRLPGGGLHRGLLAALQGQVPLALLLAALLPILALPLLNWPLSPLPAVSARHLLVFWGLLELSFALALLPGLISSSPYAARAAMREAQLALAGRVVLWLAAGVAQWALPWQDPWTLPARLLALGALLLALPVALAWGPFAGDRSVSPAGAHAGLSRQAIELAHWGHATRQAALLALAALSAVPATLPGPLRLLAVAALLLAIAFGLRSLRGRLVRRTLADALRFCWWRALPLALLGLVALWLR